MKSLLVALVFALALLVFVVNSAPGRSRTGWRPAAAARVPAERWAALCTENYRRAHHTVTRDMERVLWRRVPDGALPWGAVALTDTITNTIFVTVMFQDTVWVLSHELVHYLLAGPPGPDAHPFDPFAFPCIVMPFQHRGGIMGSRLNAQ